MYFLWLWTAMEGFQVIWEEVNTLERSKRLRCGCTVFDSGRLEHCQTHYNEDSEPDEEGLEQEDT